MRWLKDGDANTKFYFKAVIAHQARNAIRFLMNDQAIRVTNKAQIKDMVVPFCQNLLGSINNEVAPLSVEELRGLVVFRCSDGIKEELSKIPT